MKEYSVKELKKRVPRMMVLKESVKLNCFGDVTVSLSQCKFKKKLSSV